MDSASEGLKKTYIHTKLFPDMPTKQGKSFAFLWEAWWWCDLRRLQETETKELKWTWKTKNQTKPRLHSQPSLQVLKMSSKESINLLMPAFLSKLSTLLFQIVTNGIHSLKYLKNSSQYNWVFSNSHSKDCLSVGTSAAMANVTLSGEKKNLKIHVYEQKALCGLKRPRQPCGRWSCNPLQGMEPALRPIRGNSCLLKSWAIGLSWNDSIKAQRNTTLPCSCGQERNV